jgi:hypothetical protein
MLRPYQCGPGVDAAKNTTIYVFAAPLGCFGGKPALIIPDEAARPSPNNDSRTIPSLIVLVASGDR